MSHVVEFVLQQRFETFQKYLNFKYLKHFIITSIYVTCKYSEKYIVSFQKPFSLSQYLIAQLSSNKEVSLTIGKTVLEENNRLYKQMDTFVTIENINSGKFQINIFVFQKYFRNTFSKDETYHLKAHEYVCYAPETRDVRLQIYFHRNKSKLIL